MLKGLSAKGKFTTTIHAINSGVIKLSVLTPVVTGYRGLSGEHSVLRMYILPRRGAISGLALGVYVGSSPRIDTGADRLAVAPMI